MRPVLVFVALAFLVAGCGVKNDLVKPDTGKPAPHRTESDPSKPPYPIGR
jgi:predicted small lipoprotein YifL